ncbi:hypothetical protein A6769_33425 [Nostoc punctiforme NIES-2108]|uniref:Uncharacterized protein n=1 Tax=Nostoc punctiforme NIES-2108 TaxID=1356359 RepID=A0A367R1Y3_NOSPU|nr:hypothetical protein A6769_33425 [Nostoc punctiforme NIES-2108]
MNNMNEVKQEIISIKRSLESLDGKIITYLKSNPLKLDLDFSEVVVNALKAYWLPFVMHSVGVRDEELRRIAIWSIKQLEGQASLIREVFGISPQINTVVQLMNTTADYPGAIPDQGGSFDKTEQVNSQEPDSTTALSISNDVEVREELLLPDEEDYDYEKDLIAVEITEEMRRASKLFGA